MTVEQDYIKAQEILNEFESSYSIPSIKPPGTEQQLAQYLTLDSEVVQKMDMESCAEVAFFLSQYSLYIQRLVNIETSSLRWIDKKIVDYTCDKLGDYDKYMKHEYKITLIGKENSVVDSLLRKKSFVEQKIDRLTYISASIRHMADMMKNLQASKR